MTDYDVAIVGGGPVGTGLAIELGQRGISTVVIERHHEPQPIPKGQNLTQRTTEHFHFWGCEAALRAARTRPQDAGIGGMTAYGTLLSDYHYDWLNRALVREFYFTDNERLPQYATEGVLRARAAEIESVDLFYGWTGIGHEQDDDGVTVHLAAHRGDEARSFRARYLVGCDGARSGVREAAGIAQSGADHGKVAALILFRSEELNEKLKRYPGKAFYNVLHPDFEGYWQFFGRVDQDTFFFHAPVPPGTSEDNFGFTAFLHRAIGAEVALQIEYLGFWDLRVTQAEHYRQGRVFIAGDACHSHPPYGGYGINTGFEDARNLGWKLAACLQGWGGPGLLDSYEAERHPVFASTARDFIESFIEDDRKFLETYSPERDEAEFIQKWTARNAGAEEVNKFEPNYEGSPIVGGAGAPGAYGGHEVRARPGHHLTPQRLSDRRNVFEVLGPGFTLLAFDAGESALAAFVAAAESSGTPLAVVRDTLGEGREAYGAPLILVRPDQFVAWAGETGDPATILGRATGAMT
ncbi:2-polyprenyl-6-methoxyphenol hydroxylase [Palleronia marisminoris]|uniref:FAD-dependent monooxygenase n=1 Tax=Palleronia marisminoris TaxID=315423 RepID=UPI0008F1D997|nr:FAD-dependent monooxygenase [Palleronia marisminoris]SFH27452.1 2-polyprenyl-6-methoxyphenol hydroxylase [Palleronia marisminoris]